MGSASWFGGGWLHARDSRGGGGGGGGGVGIAPRREDAQWTGPRSSVGVGFLGPAANRVRERAKAQGADRRPPPGRAGPPRAEWKLGQGEWHLA
jgi:hypothetical protein